MMTPYRQGWQLADGGKNEAALMAFEEAVRQDPKNFKAIFGIGVILQRLKRHEEAIAAFSGVLEIQPKVPQAHYSRAHSHRELGRFEEALTDLDIALDMNPGYIDALYARGINLKSLERDDEAADAYEVVLAKSGKYPPASHGRGTIRHRMGDYEGAIADFTAAIEGGIDGYDIRLLRGLAYYRLERLAEAEADFTAAISFRPLEGTLYMHRFLVFKKLGKNELAEEDRKRGRELLDKKEGKSPDADPS